MGRTVLGIIGGSGVYDIEGLEDARWQRVETPWGPPSDELLTGRLSGRDVVFLPRHGRGHRIPPSDINYRANIAALKPDVVAAGNIGCIVQIAGKAGEQGGSLPVLHTIELVDWATGGPKPNIETAALSAG